MALQSTNTPVHVYLTWERWSTNGENRTVDWANPKYNFFCLRCSYLGAKGQWPQCPSPNFKNGEEWPTLVNCYGFYTCDAWTILTVSLYMWLMSSHFHRPHTSASLAYWLDRYGQGFWKYVNIVKLLSNVDSSPLSINTMACRSRTLANFLRLICSSSQWQRKTIRLFETQGKAVHMWHILLFMTLFSVC